VESVHAKVKARNIEKVDVIEDKVDKIEGIYLALIVNGHMVC
jgi:hypothetical protein